LTKPTSCFVSFLSLFPVPLLCSAPEVVQEKPENGLDLEAEEKPEEKPIVEGPVDLDLGLTEEKPENGLDPVDLGSDRGEGRGGLGEGRKSALEPRQSGGCGTRRGWLAGEIRFRQEIGVENGYVFAVFDALACPCLPEIV
jgi:hypothetical protein